MTLAGASPPSARWVPWPGLRLALTDMEKASRRPSGDHDSEPGLMGSRVAWRVVPSSIQRTWIPAASPAEVTWAMCAPFGDQTAPPTPGGAAASRRSPRRGSRARCACGRSCTSKPTANRTFEPSGETVGFSTPFELGRSNDSSGQRKRSPGRARLRRGGGGVSMEGTGLVWPRGRGEGFACARHGRGAGWSRRVLDGAPRGEERGAHLDLVAGKLARPRGYGRVDSSWAPDASLAPMSRAEHRRLTAVRVPPGAHGSVRPARRGARVVEGRHSGARRRAR